MRRLYNGGIIIEFNYRTRSDISYISDFNGSVPIRAECRRWRCSDNKMSQLSSQSNPTTEGVVDICVIGGGVAGLVAAITAAETSSKTQQSSSLLLSILLLETSDALGGRIRTDTSDGYILDRGFAVFVEDYPTSRRLLDYDALDLRRFSPGAMLKLFGHDGCFTKVADPRRRPQDALMTLFSPV